MAFCGKCGINEEIPLELRFVVQDGVCGKVYERVLDKLLDWAKSQSADWGVCVIDDLEWRGRKIVSMRFSERKEKALYESSNTRRMWFMARGVIMRCGLVDFLEPFGNPICGA